jgi:hypothetical protein
MSVKLRSIAGAPPTTTIRFRGNAGKVLLRSRQSGVPALEEVVLMTESINVVSEGSTYLYTAGEFGSLSTTFVDTSYSIYQGFLIVSFGNMPVDLSTLSFPSSGLYDATASGINFTLDVTVTPPSGLVYTGTFGSQSITGGESVSFNVLPIGPTPTLTTTLMDTSWTLKDEFDSVVATGTLPILNLRTLWTTYTLLGNTPYTMIASGITFTITRTGG